MGIFGIYLLIGTIMCFYHYVDNEKEFMDEMKDLTAFYDIKVILLIYVIICVLFWPYILYSAFVDEEEE
jgi:hypothetical protein